MTIESFIAHLVSNYGATGVTLALGIFAIRALAPLATQAVGHLSRMADAIQKLTLQLEAQGLIISEVREDVGEIQEDVAGLYALHQQARPSRPSRQRKPQAQPAAASGD